MDGGPPACVGECCGAGPTSCETSNPEAADGSESLRGSDAVADKSPSGVSDVRSDRKHPSLMCRLAYGRLQLPEKLHGGPGAVRWRSPARDGILASLSDRD